jgi:alpha-mannosidase
VSSRLARLPIWLLLASGAVAAPPKTVYIAVDDHTDYMWTADEETYRQAFLAMLDYYLDLADATADDPVHRQSRFVADGSYWLRVYEQNRTAAEFDRLMSRIATGHITAPLTPLVTLHGGAPAEATLRGMYYAGQLERRYGTRFRLALSMENQALPWGLASLWAGSGARYSWRGICGCVSQVPSPGDREHEIYRYTGPDGNGVLLKWNSMLYGSNESIGGYAEARSPSAVVDLATSNPTFLSRWPYDVIGAFGKGWDDLQTLTDEFTTVAQTMTNASRLVVVSNELDFFQHFEAQHGAGLPVVSYSFGNEWELYCASMAEVSARVKRSVEKLRAAEAMASVVAPREPEFLAGRDASRDTANLALGLYWEHDWTADGPVPRSARAAWQRRVADDIETYVNTLHADAVAALASKIPAGPYPRFFAFNPLGWTRSDAADLPWTDASPLHVVDVTTGEEVPSERRVANGQPVLRVLAHDVPPVGYRVYEIRPGAGAAFSPAATVDGATVDNGRQALTLAGRGAITSWIDHTRGDRQMVRTIGGRTVNDLGPSAGTVSVQHVGPVSATLVATAAAPVAHTSEVTVYRGSDRVDIRNRVTQGFSTVLTWAFGFELNAPVVRHEEVGAIARARKIDAGGDYATRNMRYDWLTLNHFADMSGNDGAGVTLSNRDTFFFRLGASTIGTLDTTTPQISALAGGQVDGGGLGIPVQAGDTNFEFRFALSPHAGYDPAVAMRFSLEHQNPLVCAPITGTAPELPDDHMQSIAVSNPNVLLWAFKAADDGIDRGIVARLWNVADIPQSATVQLSPWLVGSATAVSHVETDELPLPVSPAGIDLSFARQQVRSVRLEPVEPGADDQDQDGVNDAIDDCPETFDPAQGDGDADGAGDACDCAPADASTFPAAAEINDGADNQCPGDPGSGLVDEIDGGGFPAPFDRTRFEWTPQPGAVTYEVVRAYAPDLTDGCLAVTVSDPIWIDEDVPIGGDVWYYVVRALAPWPGSWGRTSSDTERLPPCALSLSTRSLVAGHYVVRATDGTSVSVD